MSDEKDNEKELKELLKESARSKATKEVLSNLTSREVKVLRMRFGIDIEASNSLEEVGRQFDVTRERIREIERKALEKLRDWNPDDGPDAA